MTSFFKVTTDDYILIINDKIEVVPDCVTDLHFREKGKRGTNIPVRVVAEILGCLVIDVSYKQHATGPYTWIIPSHVVFEKNGYQLDIRESYRDSCRSGPKWKIKVKHNHRIKNTSAISSVEGILYENGRMIET